MERTPMRKFDYRAPRFSVDLEVRLTFEDSMQEGRCCEISTEGMKLEIQQPLSPNTCGTVQLRYGDFMIDVPVRVAHSGSSYDGVKFVYESDEQRDEVIRLVALLAGAKQRLGPVLLR
ncbi:MAG: PilZ domain-containing protein, partial [Candidatus Korobacteraceae bacterium]